MKFRQWFCNHKWKIIDNFYRPYKYSFTDGEHGSGSENVIRQECPKCGTLRQRKFR